MSEDPTEPSLNFPKQEQPATSDILARINGTMIPHEDFMLNLHDVFFRLAEKFHLRVRFELTPTGGYDPKVHYLKIFYLPQDRAISEKDLHTDLMEIIRFLTTACRFLRYNFSLTQDVRYSQNLGKKYTVRFNTDTKWYDAEAVVYFFSLADDSIAESAT